MADLPLNVSTGMVTGRFVIAAIDGADAAQEPDAIPASGTVTFTSPLTYAPDQTASPSPVTILFAPIVGVFDEEGYLSTPHPVTGEAMYRGVKLIATDDPDISVTDWTWTATYAFNPVAGVKPAIASHAFALPSGSTQDLTTLVQVPSSPGYGLPQAEAAVNETITGAVVVGDDLQMTRRNGGTFIAGNVRGAPGADSTVPGPPGPVSTVPGPPGADSTVPGPPGPKGDPGPSGVSNTDQFYQVSETAGRTVSVWDYLNSRYQLIYGDTGLREIAGLLSVGTATNVYLRREGNLVHLIVRNWLPASGGVGTEGFLTLPSGFRPVFALEGLVGTRPSSTPATARIYGNVVNFITTGSAGATLSATFATSDPWPSSLPGVAA
ncbi:hypothetical protein [Glutamicibacter ardleyensis]|uniref:Minor tail protein n=1 Tax=Glutamicibacter ardleyensis TaxID=225894 RepID=A0ABQ2DWI1_9MICC|nr:hypothetical protein [Glutamicibacter ardleyensis]GGJ74325.1 hypothetical protein GCM10007173_36570 [Glutamicibacter ardleyensis]